MSPLPRLLRAVGPSILVVVGSVCIGGSNAGSVQAKARTTPSHILPARAGRDGACPGRLVRKRCFSHVLLISIDGMHGVDLEKFVAAHS